MPIIYDASVYEVDVAPPVTLRSVIKKDQFTNARKRFGTENINGAKFKYIVDVCPEDNPDCTTPTPALNVTLIGFKDTTYWSLDVWFLEYYVAPSVKISNRLFDYGKETDVAVDVTFSGSRIRVAVNGSTVLETDMMKGIGKIKKITSDTYYFDTAGANINKYIDELAFVLDVAKAYDISQIINAILPVAVSVGVLGAVFGILRYIIPAIRR